MGVCGSKTNKRSNKTKSQIESKINQNNIDSDRVKEVEIKDSELKPLNNNIYKVSPSVCKITTNKINGTGFFIKLYINNNILLACNNKRNDRK